MPAYGTLNPPTALYSGDAALAYNVEQPASGTLSERFALAPNIDGIEMGFSITFQFSGAPGAFEFDIYESDIDLLGNFIQVPVAGVVNAVNANNFARVDLDPFMGNYIAIFCKTQNANAVNVTVRVTRRG